MQCYARQFSCNLLSNGPVSRALQALADVLAGASFALNIPKSRTLMTPRETFSHVTRP